MEQNPLFISKAFNIIQSFDNQQDEHTITQLIQKCNTSWGHSQKIIKQLIKKGYLTQDKNPPDKRKRIIKLTEKGKKIWQITKEINPLI